MLNKVYGGSVLVIFSILLLLAGCGKNCSQIICGVNQVCNPSIGACFCRNGYEGANCDSLSFKKYIHTYYMSDQCSGSSNTAYISNGASADVSELGIYGFLNLSSPVTAYINSTSDHKGTYVQIPSQTFGALTIDGYGNYETYNNRAKITFNINYNDGLNNKGCTVIFNQY